jgi:hypothetical protein
LFDWFSTPAACYHGKSPTSLPPTVSTTSSHQLLLPVEFPPLPILHSSFFTLHVLPPPSSPAGSISMIDHLSDFRIASPRHQPKANKVSVRLYVTGQISSLPCSTLSPSSLLTYLVQGHQRPRITILKMVGIPSVARLTVRIVANSVYCKEFAYDNENGSPAPTSGSVVTTYVQTPPDAVFEIHVHVGKTYPHRNYDMYILPSVGGIEMTGLVCHKNLYSSDSQPGNFILQGATSTTRGQSTLRKFKLHTIITGKFPLFPRVMCY